MTDYIGRSTLYILFNFLLNVPLSKLSIYGSIVAP